MTAAVVKFGRGLLSSDGIFSFTGLVLVSQLDDRSRMTRECHVRICGGLGGKFPGASWHPGVKAFLAAGILALSRDQDLREIQLIHQIQQEVHLVIPREPVTR